MANVTGEARGITARGKGAPRPGPHLTAEGVAQLAQFLARLAECGEWRPPPPTIAGDGPAPLSAANRHSHTSVGSDTVLRSLAVAFQ